MSMTVASSWMISLSTSSCLIKSSYNAMRSGRSRIMIALRWGSATIRGVWAPLNAMAKDDEPCWAAASFGAPFPAGSVGLPWEGGLLLVAPAGYSDIAACADIGDGALDTEPL